LGGGQRKDRPQALAAGEQAVTHGLADLCRAGRCRRKVTLERRIDVDPTRFEPVAKIAWPPERVARRWPHRVRSSPSASDAGAALISPRSLRISTRRSASSSLVWQKRDSD